MLGADPNRDREDVSEEDLRELVQQQRGFTRQQREIIAGAMDIAERSLREVLIPRRSVVSINAASSAADAREVLVACGHSRAPVVERDLDDVVGVVHLRDIVHAQGEVRTLARGIFTLPETVNVLEALRQLQVQRQSLALVTNEYGGTEGLVTVEDLVEELVGEIYDETDRDVRAVRTEPDGSITLPGTFPMHDLVDVGVQFPLGEYSTVAGLVLDRLGYIPKAGERLTVDGWSIEVLAMDGRAIHRLRLKPAG